MWPFKKKTFAPQGELAVGNFTLTAQLAGQSGRSMNVAGYIYLKDTEAELNARLDMYQQVIERQRIRCEIPELEAKRDQMQKGVLQAQDVLNELEHKRNNGERLSSQELLNVQNMRTNIKRAAEEIQKGEEAIREAKRKAGVG